MNNLITYFLISNLSLLLFFIFYKMLFSGTTLFKETRTFLNVSVIGSLIIPLFYGVFSPTAASQDVAMIYTLDDIIVTGTQSALSPANSISLLWAILWVYLIGVLFMSARLAVSFFKIKSILNTHQVVNKKGVKVVLTSGEMPIFTFMGYLFWNTSIDLNPIEKSNIIRHELTHLKQRHGVDILVFELLKIIMWFNPLVYILRKEIGEVHEFLADKGAIRTEKVSTYGRLLFNQLFERTNLSNVNYFNQSQIKNRIIMITKSKTPNPLNWRSWTLGFSMLAIFSIIACSENMEANPTNSSVEIQQSSNSDSVFQVVEQMPEFEGGFDGLVQFIGSEVKYPLEAKDRELEGKVFISFVVNEKGNVTNVEVKKSLDPSLDAEALRVVKAMPKYAKPGIHKGKPVKVQMVLPIDFRLTSAK